MPPVINTLDIGLSQMFALRDKWDFYTIALSNGRTEPQPDLKQDLDYAVKLWLLDAYCNVHDYFKRTLITARKIHKRTAKNIDRNKLFQEIMIRLSKVEKTIEAQPIIANLFLNLKLDALKSSIAVANKYFSSTNAFLENISQKDGELLLRKLSMMIVEEELPLPVSIR